MKKLLLGVAVLVSAMLFGVSGAKAIMFGEVDTENDYPWVGMMLAVDEEGAPLWRCSGSLISEDVFLTAAHCVEEPAASVRIWFDVGPITTDPQYRANLEAGLEDPCTGVTGYPCAGYDATGEPIPHPEYDSFQTFPNTRDVGIVLLDQPYALDEYGVLAPLGTLDALATQRGKQNTSFTVVGYGLQAVRPQELAARVRYVGTVQLVNLRSALAGGFHLAHSGAPGKGTGGSATCFGDSGGPILYEGQIVAVTSWGPGPTCMGPGFGYRTDIDDTMDFLGEYLQ